MRFKSLTKPTIVFIMVGLGITILSGQQQSGREFRRTGIHNGNLVRTVFGNWGVIGQPADEGPRGAWINDNNGYIGDVSPLIGAEVTAPDTGGNLITFHSVVVPPVDRPITGGFEESPDGKAWTFEPVSGFLNETQERIAMSTDQSTWPPYWPDKQDAIDDPGWAGSWNGYFGKDLQNIQQESYYVMDDNNDEEFNSPDDNQWDVTFKPDATDSLRNGLGLEVAVRGMQWQQFLAQDCIFWLYEVTNTSTTDYSKITFGMLVGTYVGVTSTEDRGEYDDDWSFFDVNDDITYTGDYDNDVSRNPKWVGSVGMVGYAFLESPGNPFDGIDNDGDYDAVEGLGFAPLFEETDFDSTIINIGDEIVLIDEQFERTSFTIPDQDTVIINTRGLTVTILPGITYVAEGNPIIDNQDRENVNTNAFDGFDNDLDGLIDENYYLHYRQRRVDQFGQVLFDEINPRAYKDYINDLGTTNPLIDEKRDDGIDNDGDWDPEYDDVGVDGITDSQDYGEGDGNPNPGEPNFDKTDVDESDQIGLTSFNYFTPAGEFPMSNDEELWEMLHPGFFDTPSSISEGEPIAGEDGDFVYGSGYFPLLAGKTERFSLALVYGKDLDELIDNKRTVQNIYNNNYRFPPPPLKPTMTAVAGDGEVALYWDRVAESSIDPITKREDFQGYKLYRATDANFNDVRNITNANGIIEGYSPIAQFDLDDELPLYFYPSNTLFQEAQGYSFYLGDNSGLQHSYVDRDVQNGRTYYYALVAYDSGEEDKDIFPAENTKFISILPSGEIITDKNTAVVTPSSKAAGYTLNDTIPVNYISGIATGSIAVEVVDEVALTGHDYEITFIDQYTDQVDNDGDWDPNNDDVGSDGLAGTFDPDSTELNGQPDSGEPNVDQRDLDEYTPITTYYSVRDLDFTDYTFTANDTLVALIPYRNLIEGTITLSNSFGDIIPEANYVIDPEFGRIRGTFEDALGRDEYTINFKYYPILNSPYMHLSSWTNQNQVPYVPETLDSEVFAGLRLNFDNDWAINPIDTLTYWWTAAGGDTTGKDYKISADGDTIWIEDNGDSTYFYSIGLQHFPEFNLYAETIPADYQIVFSDDPTFGQASNFPIPDPGANTNFRIYNTTNNAEIPYLFTDSGRDGVLDHLDILYFFERDEVDTTYYHYSWSITFTRRQVHADTVQFNFGTGDTLFMSMSKPFRQGDIYQFTAPKPTVPADSVEKHMDQIRVVPNPYYSAHRFEAPLPPGITSGRGDRRIYFQNVPNDAEVHIFTTRGQHLKTLTATGDIHNGTVTWNLKTKENLDIAFGVYFYIVESPIGGKQSGKFAVIK